MYVCININDREGRNKDYAWVKVQGHIHSPVTCFD